MATKEEKELFQELKNELRGTNTRIERLTRQLEIQNLLTIMTTSFSGVDRDRLIAESKLVLDANDVFESVLKQHAIDAAKKKSQQLKNDVKDGD